MRKNGYNRKGFTRNCSELLIHDRITITEKIEGLNLEQKTKIRQELKRQRLWNSRAWKIILGILIVLAAVYIVGCVYYSRHFYGGGTVFWIQMRNQTAESLKEQIIQKVGEYQLKIVTRDGEETITADQIGLEYDDQGEIEQLLEEQKTAAWFLMAASSKEDRGVQMTVDETRLSEAVQGLSCMQEENMTAPTDAHLEYVDGAFAIQEETYGNQLEYDTVYNTVRESVTSGETEISLEDLSCYVAPAIYKDDERLQEECDAVNKMINVEITYDFSDRQMVVDKSVIKDWITFGDNFTYDLSEEAVGDYVYDMAYETDTFGLTRKFTTHSGQEITLKGGDYGWCINRSETVEQLIGLVKAGENVTVEPVYLYSGICRDTNDIGGTYVEVSISDQYMWVYKDGECVVSTPVVTGNPSRGWDTPAGGVWAVDARISPYTLTGQDYNTDVTYWLPFNGNVGIHDADWRSSFGGSIYRTNGSHGCVNTPPEAMKTVYEVIKIGYPVVVY